MEAVAHVEYRFILRDRAGQDVLHPVTGKPYVYPSYMAALRGRAMVDCNAFIIQQERANEL
jgi:hypothetical protein